MSTGWVAPLIPVNEGGRRIGQTHHRAKLSDGAVEQILVLHGTGLSYAKIAEKFGCAKSTVRDICTGRIRSQLCAHRFKHVDWTPAVIAPLPLAVTGLESHLEWSPGPAPSPKSLDLPALDNNEEPGQRAMRLVCWAVLKEPQHDHIT